jgi:hypothetical protein
MKDLAGVVLLEKPFDEQALVTGIPNKQVKLPH